MRFSVISAMCITMLIASFTYSQPPGCGNNCKSLLSGCKDCPPDPAGTNIFSAYTGNVNREVLDLEVWGGAGDTQLLWKRFYNSRNGWQVWTHSFQFSMSFEGLDDQGRALLQVTYPEGGGNIFTQSTTDPGTWLPPPGINKRIFQQGNNYFLQMANGYRYRFEKINSPVYGITYQLQDFRDAYQNIYTLMYDAWHNLLRITEPAGRFLELEYTLLHGKLVTSKVKTNDGRSVSYNYSLYNDGILDWLLLTSVKYGDGTMATYSYGQSEPGRLMLLKHAVDPRLSGTAVNMQYLYDVNVAEGFIKEERNGATGAVTATLKTVEGHRWVCYPNGRVQHYIMPTGLLGATKEYIDGLGRSTQWEYEDNGIGFVKSRTDALGHTTSYIKSIYGNDLKVTHPTGATETWTRDDLDLVLSYTDELGRTTVYTRDNMHRITRVTYADGTNEQFTYNNRGQVLTHVLPNGAIEKYGYDSRGLRVSLTDGLGNMTLFSYDANDRLKQITDALHRAATFEYNERGLPVKVINADNSFKSFGYDDFGNLTTTTNELGNSWKKTYDEFKRLTRQVDPLNRQTVFSYDLPGGGCACSHDNDNPTKIVSPTGSTTIVEYDAEWQMIRDTRGAGSPEAAVTSYEYDAAGNIARIIDPRGKPWNYVYDSRNQKTSVINPLGHKMVWTYDLAGNTISIERPGNGVFAYQYNNMNRQVQVRDPAGQTIKMAYDAAGNLVTLMDANNNSYHYEYDLLNRRLKMIYPDGSRELSSYDAVGNRNSFTTRSGQVCTYTFDARNREVSAIWSDNTPAVSNSYDAAGRIIAQSSMVSQINYSYDNADQLIAETQNIPGAGGARQINYTYNGDGLVDELFYPSGIILKYHYTARNQLSSISENGAYMASYAYDLNGNRLAQFRKNAVGTEYIYDDNNRAVSITHQKAGVAFAHFDYGYDNVNRRTYVRRNYGQGDVFAYDAVDQLVNVKYNASNPQGTPSGAAREVHYNYDPVGNRINMQDNGSQTNYSANALNQYTSVGGNALSYDGNGNLVNGNGWSYIYDAQNRLVQAQNATATVNLAYDARGRCVKRSVNGVTTYLYYDRWRLAEEQRATGITRYIHGPDLDELVLKEDAAGAISYHYDALGNVTQLTNSLGNVVEQYTYDAFGTAAIKDGGGNIIGSSAFNNRFLFTGREFIPEIGLYDYRRRMYSPVLGRFVQSDPIGFDGGDINIYRYVGNNPVNRKDPLGTGDMPVLNPNVPDPDLVNPPPVIIDLTDIGQPGTVIIIIVKHKRVCGQLIREVIRIRARKGGGPGVIENSQTIPLTPPIII